MNLVFVDTSNHLGAGESGFVAGATSPTFAVVSGGVVCVVALGVIVVLMPALRGFVFPDEESVEVFAPPPPDMTT